MIIIDGTLIKCDKTEKRMILPDSVKYVLSTAFSKDVEYIYGENVEKIIGTFEYEKLRGLHFPKLKTANKIKCPNLKEFTMSNEFKCKGISKTPSKINIEEESYHHSYYAEEMLKYIDGLYNKGVYRNGANVIYLHKKGKSFTCHDTSLINSITYLNKLLSMIPNNIRETIFESNYNIFITNTYFRSENDFIAGVSFHRLKLCVVSEMNLLELLHEFGHIYDNLLQISSSLEFLEIYRKEKGLLGKRDNVSFEHINSSNREFFAESFKRYILNKEEFYNECPLTKDFLDEVFSKEAKTKKKQLM